MSKNPFHLLPWLAALAAVLLALPARAQFNGGSGAAPSPPMPGGGYNPAAMGAYGGSGGYGYGPTTWRQTPMQGYMNGAANITTANADYQMTIQQAKLAREQVHRSALKTRRATLEERNYELSIQPTAEELRQKDLAMRLQTARNNPPRTLIWSGEALNQLLRAIKDGQSHGLTGPEVPLSPEVVRHINVTSGTTPGGVGVLKDGGKLTWPIALRQPSFDEQRNQLNKMFQQAADQAPSGQVDIGLLNNIGSSLKELQRGLDAHVDDLSPGQFIEASRYARDLKAGYQVLQQGDVAKYFKPNWTPRGSTVAELVQQMTSEGLRFAPATSGEESYYTSLHRSLVDYDIGIAKMAGSVARR